jgi:hypothetical protein
MAEVEAVTAAVTWLVAGAVVTWVAAGVVVA